MPDDQVPEENLRLRILRGEEIHPDPPDTEELLVKKAKSTLLSVMDDHDAKPSERLAAADSVLDRYAEPRKKHELGGSRTVNLSLSPEAMHAALGSLTKLFTPKEELDAIPVAPSPGSLPSPDDLSRTHPTS